MYFHNLIVFLKLMYLNCSYDGEIILGVLFQFFFYNHPLMLYNKNAYFLLTPNLTLLCSPLIIALKLFSIEINYVNILHISAIAFLQPFMLQYFSKYSFSKYFRDRWAKYWSNSSIVSVISLKWEAKTVVVSKEVVGNFESLKR